MTVSLGEEFRLKNFGLGYDKAFQFYVSEWRRLPDGVYIGWRVFWGLWHIAWLIRSVHSQIVDNADYDPDEGAKWFIYLTNWSYLVLAIQAVIHMVIVIATRCTHGGKPVYAQGAPNPWYNKVLWVSTSISFAAAIVVTIFYWTLVFTELKRALSIMTHAVTTFYAVTDVFISASPVRLLHVIYPTIYGAVYLIFSIFYHLGDGTNNEMKPYIYSSLDWSKPGETTGLAIGVVFVAVPLGHLFIFGLYTLRCYLATTCCGQVSPEDEETGDAKP